MDETSREQAQETSRAEGAETARRALRLLELVSRSRGPIGLGELVRQTELNKSTVYRLLRVLQDEKYVDRLEGGGYSVGSRLVALAIAAVPDVDSFGRWEPLLQELAESSGETATLHGLAGDRAVLIRGATSPRAYPLRRIWEAGELTPLTRGGAGPAIMTTLPTPMVDRILVNESSDEAVRVRSTLHEIGQRGFIITFGVNHPGLAGIAVPVAVANVSVAVSGPATRWTKARMTRFAPQMLTAIAGFADGLENPARRPSAG